MAIAHGKGLVDCAPSAGPDGALTLDEEARLYAHYGLEYSMSRSESGLPEPAVAGVDSAYVEVEEVDVQTVAAAPRMRRRRADEDFDMVRLPSKDVPIVVKQQKSDGPH